MLLITRAEVTSTITPTICGTQRGYDGAWPYCGIDGQITAYSTNNNQISIPPIITVVYQSSQGNVSNSTALPKTTTSTPSPSASVKPIPVSGGTIAGAVLGGAIGLALVAALLVFFFRKFERQRPPTSERAQAIYARLSHRQKSEKCRKVPPHIASVLDGLPLPATEDEIKQRLSRVLSQLGRHAADCYRDVAVEIDAKLEHQLALFETARLPESLTYCFTITKKPANLIQHCLLFHVINLTLSPGAGTRPLLPKDIACVIANMHHKVTSESCQPDIASAFNLWKQLTTYLRNNETAVDELPRDRLDKIMGFSEQFTDVFAPWSKPEIQPEDRKKHLSDCLRTAVQTATWLFSQPQIYAFDWSVSSVPNGSCQIGRHVVILPGVGEVNIGEKQLRDYTSPLFQSVQKDL